MTSSQSQFGPELGERIVARVELGVSYSDAATAAGVKLSTAKGWLAKGRKEDSGPYAEFAGAIERAREKADARPAGMSAEDFRAQVEQAIRGGSVQAMKLWADLYHEPDVEPEPESPPSKIASLAERRRNGGKA